jgi:hypothetical protein
MNVPEGKLTIISSIVGSLHHASLMWAGFYFPLPAVLKVRPGWMISKMIPNFDVESQVRTNQTVITLSSCGMSL